MHGWSGWNNRLLSMDNSGFQAALDGRVDDMLSACTKCGACFEACPITDAAGIGKANPAAVVAGVLDIVRMGERPKEAETWAKSCVLSGECIKACDYGVNPRFLLAMARLALAKNQNELPERRRQGVTTFRDVSRDHAVAIAARRRDAGAARPEIGVGTGAGRGAGL